VELREEIRDGGRLLLKSARLMNGTGNINHAGGGDIHWFCGGLFASGGLFRYRGHEVEQRPSARAKALMSPFKA
jgi:hypothetical protein